ncbi:MAG: tetratricopeptide repeat protein [Alphaproteobacteria bacterium]
MTLAAALGLLQGGDLKGAEKLCARLLKRDPGDAQTQHLMGLIILHAGRPSEAHALLKKAAKSQSDNPECHYNLAECCRALGKPEPAIAAYKRMLALSPGDGRAHMGIAEAHMAKGRPAQAETSFRAAAAARPDLATVWNGLGLALREQGRLEEAIESWGRALALDDRLAVVYNNLGLALHGLGRIHEAAAALVQALELDPDNAAMLRNFASCLKNRSVEQLTPSLRRWLEVCFNDPEIDTQSLLPAALAALEAMDGVTAALDQAGALPEAAARDALFHRMSETTFISRADWEDLLTRLRQSLLAAPGEAPPGLLFAMARQGFNNEYIFAASEAEQAAVRALGEAIDSRLSEGAAQPTAALESDLARLALYRPLGELAGMDTLPEAGWSAGFQPILDSQVRAPRVEAGLRAAIPAMDTGGGDAVSAAVKALYEENPYPRWMTVAGRQAQPLDAVMRGLFPHFRTPDSLFGALDVLAAGCGTGKQAITLATRFADCRVLAMDLSFTSLAYAMRMAGRLDVGNIDFRQGDILDLASLGRRFHVIESVGVLHHLADPLAGWRVLSALLRPRGLMKIGLYSAAARRHLVAAQSFVTAQGYPPTPAGIRRCRRDIAALPADRIERKVMENRDFYSTSSCRDLLFHVQEHRFTLAEIERMLKELGLRFIGFELNNLEAVAAYGADYPDDPERTDLGQ